MWGALALLAVACKVSPPGEWDLAQCSDGDDNDLDGKTDCADPDCWVYACVDHTVPPPEAGRDNPPAIDASIPVPDSGPLTPPPLPPPSLPEDDAGLDPEEDAGPPPRAKCKDSWTCSPGEQCLNGYCEPVDISGDYVLEVISAHVPARSMNGTCYDFDLPCLPGLDCPGCDPDVFIVVTQNSVKTVGTTAVRNNTSNPTWSNESFELHLQTGDRLDFAAWEYDNPTDFGKTRMFSCRPDFRLLDSGMLSCSPPASMTIEPENGMRFEIVAKIRLR